jgi:hypothetical protein
MLGDEGALVAGLAAGMTMPHIATAAGMSISSVQRRRRDPRIKSLVRELRDENREETLGRLASMRTTALVRLAALMEDPDPTVALRAIRLVLGSSASFETVQDLAGRVSELEKAAQLADDAEWGFEAADDDDDVEPGTDVAVAGQLLDARSGTQVDQPAPEFPTPELEENIGGNNAAGSSSSTRSARRASASQATEAGAL